MNTADSNDTETGALTRPTGYKNPAARERYNLVVIGAGTAGLVAATGAAALGARVALVEKRRIGGDRLNSGDVPSKTLIAAARTMSQVRRAERFGVRVAGEAQVDFGLVMERIRRLRERIGAADSVTKLTQQGVEVHFGAARFEDATHVVVEGQRLAFSRAVIATGSSPALPPIPGLDAIEPLTSESVLALKKPPSRLAVIGAGPAGCEMAQVFARFGSRVIVYDKEPRILPDEDLVPAEIIREALQRDGVEFRLTCTEVRADIAERGKRLRGWSAGDSFTDEFDEVFVASGRVPNVQDLNLEAAHVNYDESGILVDDHLRTSNGRIFAAGDVCSKGRFTHAAEALARTVIANALFLGTQRISAALIPWCTFTDPEIARVGIGENDEQSKECTCFDLPLAGNDRALIDGQEEGLLRIYHDRHGRIQGATLVAERAGEIIGEIVIAMRHNIRLGSLASDIHPYPTQSEIIKRAGDTYRRTLLTPSVSKFLKKFLEWRR